MRRPHRSERRSQFSDGNCPTDLRAALPVPGCERGVETSKALSWSAVIRGTPLNAIKQNSGSGRYSRDTPGADRDCFMTKARPGPSRDEDYGYHGATLLEHSCEGMSARSGRFEVGDRAVEKARA